MIKRKVFLFFIILTFDWSSTASAVSENTGSVVFSGNITQSACIVSTATGDANQTIKMNQNISGSDMNNPTKGFTFDQTNFSVTLENCSTATYSSANIVLNGAVDSHMIVYLQLLEREPKVGL